VCATLQRKLESQLASVRAETDSKRSQIVSSPLRVRDDLDAATRAAEEAQSELSTVEDERRALTRRLEVVRKAEKDVSKALALLGEVEAEIARLKSVSKAVKQRASDVAAAEAELGALQATSRQLEESIRSKDERLGQLRLEFDSRAGSADRESVSLRQELSSLQQQLADARQSRADAEIRRKQLDEMVRARVRAGCASFAQRNRVDPYCHAGFTWNADGRHHPRPAFNSTFAMALAHCRRSAVWRSTTRTWRTCPPVSSRSRRPSPSTTQACSRRWPRWPRQAPQQRPEHAQRPRQRMQQGTSDDHRGDPDERPAAAARRGSQPRAHGYDLSSCLGKNRCMHLLFEDARTPQLWSRFIMHRMHCSLGWSQPL